jgi:hypothetical protein
MLRLLKGDASSVCNFNIGVAARLVVVCYLLCSAEFAIRQRHYSASLQLAFIALRQKVTPVRDKKSQIKVGNLAIYLYLYS